MRMRAGLGTQTKCQGVLALLGLDNINPGLSTIEPEDTNSRVFPLGLHQRNGPVQSHGAIEDVLENISVVQPVGLVVVAVAATGFLQRQRPSVFGNAKHMLVAGASDVTSNTLGTTRLGIGISTKRLLEPGALVKVGRDLCRLGFVLLLLTILAFSPSIPYIPIRA